MCSKSPLSLLSHIFLEATSAWVALCFSLNNYLSQYAAVSLESTDVSFSDSSYLLPNLEGQ